LLFLCNHIILSLLRVFQVYFYQSLVDRIQGVKDEDVLAYDTHYMIIFFEVFHDCYQLDACWRRSFSIRILPLMPYDPAM
jgi:hypothetical protein